MLQATSGFHVDGLQLRVWLGLLPPTEANSQDGAACRPPPDSPLTPFNESAIFARPDGSAGDYMQCVLLPPSCARARAHAHMRTTLHGAAPRRAPLPTPRRLAEAHSQAEHESRADPSPFIVWRLELRHKKEADAKTSRDRGALLPLAIARAVVIPPV